MDSDSDCEMDPRAEPRVDKGKTPVPAAHAAATAPPPSPHPAAKTPAIFKKSLLKAPEREKVRAQSPLKFSAVERKRQRESDAAATAAATASDDTAPAIAAPPSSATFAFESGVAGPAFNLETQALHAEIRDLKQQLASFATLFASSQASMTAQVSGLSAQVTSLSQQVARPSAAPQPPAITKTYSSAGTPRTYTAPATAAGPPPTMPPAKPSLKLSLGKKPAPQAQPAAAGESYASVTAAAAAADPAADKSFTVVSNKKKAKAQKKGPLKPLYNPNDQKVIVQVHPDTPPQESVQMTWQYLQMANRAVREYQKDLDYCFIRCHVTMKQNLVLQTSMKTQGPDYLPYLEAIKARLEEEGKLQVTAIDGEPRWSKFLLHGVPTSASMEDVALSIQQSYPGVLKLAQTPRWLTTETNRQTSPKGMSTMALSIAGRHTLQSLGYQYLYVCNSRCRLDRYLPYGPSSQCGNCCKFGHPTTLCQDKTPTCGVCGKEHATRFHPCPAPDCRGGGRCTHPPMRCVNCENSLHTSISPQCPSREKARQRHLSTGAQTEYDTSIQIDPPVSPPHDGPSN